MSALIVLSLFAATPAAADVIPDYPDPDCDDGFVVEVDHGGAHCVRPSCRSSVDCPEGLVCPERSCVEYVPDQPCLDGLQSSAYARGPQRNALEPPPPCPPIAMDRGACGADESCPDGAHCQIGRCTPGSTAPEHNGAPSDPGAPPTTSGGGCCGSRGAGSSAALIVPFLVGGFWLGRRRRGGM